MRRAKIVCTIANGKSVAERHPKIPGPFNECIGLCLTIDNLANHLAGQLAVLDLQSVRAF